MGKPHKHAEVIYAIADGKYAQFRKEGQWVDFDVSENYSPIERPDLEWRIKPEPKPDVVKYIYAHVDFNGYEATTMNCDLDNIKITFCGETGKLKSVEVLS